MDFEFETTRTGLANAFAAAGAELLAYQPLVSTAVAPIPDTQPQKYAVAGTLPSILQMAGKMMGEDAVEQPTGDLTDEQIDQVAREAVAAGKLSWLGFEKDEDGRYTIPVLSTTHYQFARAISAYLARQPKAEQPLWDDNGEPWNEAAEKADRATRPDHTAVPPADVIAAAELPPLPLEDERCVHIYPSDLAKMECSETTAVVFSVAVGNPNGETSVPLYTADDMREYAWSAIARAKSAAPTAAQAAGRSVAVPEATRNVLQAARKYIEAAGEISGYGFSRPANPHHFHPDAESCSAEEIAAHKAACEAYDKGEYTPERGSEWVGAMHILRAPWGIGSYTFMDPHAEGIIADIDAALAEVAPAGTQNAEAIRNQALDFANEIINGAFDGGDWGGGDVQELAVKHGLLKLETMAEPCGDECRCAQGVPFFPAECYRKTYVAALQTGSANTQEGGNHE